MAGSSNEFSFEDIQALCPQHDLEKFRDSFAVMLDMNGAVMSDTVGFHVDVDAEEPEQVALCQELLDIFSPVAIWAGNPSVQARFRELGHQSVVVPFFQDGGFLVVFKIPAGYGALTSVG